MTRVEWVLFTGQVMLFIWNGLLFRVLTGLQKVAVLQDAQIRLLNQDPDT